MEHVDLYHQTNFFLPCVTTVYDIKQHVQLRMGNIQQTPA